MALSSTTKGFWPRKNIGGMELPEPFEFIIANSEVVTLGDAVTLVSGYIEVVDSGDPVLGVVVGIVDRFGVPINHPDADHDGTVTGDDTFTAAADNATDHKVKVQVIIHPDVLYYNDADSDLTAAEVGTYFDTTATGDQITGTGTTKGAFQLISLDPDGDADASKGLFKISESQLLAYAQQA